MWTFLCAASSRPTTRRAILTVGAFGLAQFIVLLGAFVRIPLITGAIGASGYGLFVVITSVNPIVNVLAGGLGGASRVSVSNFPESTGSIVRHLRRYGTVATLIVATVAVLLATFGARFFDPAVGLALGVSIFTVSLVLPFSPYSGALEAHGHTALAHLTLTANTVVGVPLLICGLALTESLLAVVIATALGLLAPLVLNVVLVRRLTPYMRTLEAHVPEAVGGESLQRLSTSMTGWSLANLLVYAFDALIVAGASGVTAAGEYGLAARIVILVTVVPEALGNLLVVHFTHLRAQGQRVLLVKRLKLISAVLGGIGVTLGLAFAVGGPFLARLLSRGELEAPTLLYVMFGLFGAITASTQAFLSACSSPGMAPSRAKVGIAWGAANIALSIPMAMWLGPAGPVAASIVCITGIAVCLITIAIKRPALLLN